MGIYIRGMEMPIERQLIVIDSYGQVWSNEWPTRGYVRIDGAKAVPVPPHGRGIDADALLNKHFGKMYFEKVMTATKEEMNIALTNIPLVINNAPTIIEAEEGE